MIENSKTGRRDFIKKTALMTGALGVGGPSAFAMSNQTPMSKNPLPKWKGFNLLDFFSPNPKPSRWSTTEEDLKWMRDWGFDFVRFPMAYPSYLEFDRSRDITPDEVFSLSEEALERVDKLVDLAHQYGMHVSLNLHRAPGYCINAGFREPYNLWKDREMLETFYDPWIKLAQSGKRHRLCPVEFQG